MILTVHALVGAAIGSKIHNLWIVSIVSIIIHFLLDRLPHRDYGPDKKWKNLSRGRLLFFGSQIFIDFLIAVSLTYWIIVFLPSSGRYILVGVFFSLLPDGFILLYHFNEIFFKKQIKILKKYYLFHYANHIPENKNPLVPGILIGGLLIIISIFLILH